MEIKINHLTYGIMNIAIEIRSKDHTNYEVKITDVTLYKNNHIKNREISNLKLNTLNPDSLEILKTSKDYPRNMIIGIIKSSLDMAFAGININTHRDELTTKREQSQNKALLLAKKNFSGYAHVPKVINW